MSFTVATYNILHPTFAIRWNESEGLIPGTKNSNWLTRKEVLKENIKNLNVDILCLQEISEESLKDLQASLQALGYSTIHGRHMTSDDGVAVAFKKDRFKLLSSDKGVGSKTSKRHLILNLEDRLASVTNNIIQVTSCHLKGGALPLQAPPLNTFGLSSSHQAGVKQQDHPGKQHIKEIVEHMDSKPDSAHVKIIAGDFNQDSTSYLDKNDPSQLASNKRTVLEEAGYQFDNDMSEMTEMRKKRKIDWVYVKPTDPNVISLEHVNRPGNLKTASDHMPTITKVNYVVSSTNTSAQQNIQAPQVIPQAASFYPSSVPTPPTKVIPNMTQTFYPNPQPQTSATPIQTPQVASFYPSSVPTPPTKVIPNTTQAFYPNPQPQASTPPTSGTKVISNPVHKNMTQVSNSSRQNVAPKKKKSVFRRIGSAIAWPFVQLGKLFARLFRK